MKIYTTSFLSSNFNYSLNRMQKIISIVQHLIELMFLNGVRNRLKMIKSKYFLILNKYPYRLSWTICKKQFCMDCRVEWHEGISWSDYKKLKEYKPEDRAFFNFIKKTKYKQCPKCKFWVGRSQGCNHMTCRWKFEFWYRCGKEYKNKKKQWTWGLHQG